MKPALRLSTVLLALLSPLAVSHAEAPQPDAKTLQETRAVSGELLKTLAGKLQESMQANGPAASIDVCHKLGPEIAMNLADRTGWKITRVGTRVRNVDLGSPNGWQHKALAHLNIDLKNGADPKTLEWTEVVQEGGKPTLHYAKAIVLQPQCMACHGGAESIAAPVAERIKALYPHDQATGYKPGELRGAVVVSRPL